MSPNGTVYLMTFNDRLEPRFFAESKSKLTSLDPSEREVLEILKVDYNKYFYIIT